MRARVSKYFYGLLAMAAGLFVASAGATEYIKTTTITSVTAQGSRPVQTSTQNSELINLASGPVWTVNGGSGGTLCPEGAAVLPSGNTLMRAIALSAASSGVSVLVAVDNSLATVGGYCQISMLTLITSQ